MVYIQLWFFFKAQLYNCSKPFHTALTFQREFFRLLKKHLEKDNSLDLNLVKNKGMSPLSLGSSLVHLASSEPGPNSSALVQVDYVYAVTQEQLWLYNMHIWSPHIKLKEFEQSLISAQICKAIV